MTREHNLPEGEILLVQPGFLLQRLHHVCHEPFEAAWVLQFPAERVRRIVWALRHDQDRVASARHQLFYELVLHQNPFYIVSPAMKVNDEVNLARLAEAFGKEDRHPVV